MTDDTYNGWANRETWAFMLHVNNDQGLYAEARNVGELYAAETYGEEWRELPEDEMRGLEWGVGERVVKHFRDMIAGWTEDFGSPLPEGMTMFRDEVGSWWRIDYAEVGEAVREMLEDD